MGTNLRFRIRPHGWTKKSLLAELQLSGTFSAVEELLLMKERRIIELKNRLAEYEKEINQ